MWIHSFFFAGCELYVDVDGPSMMAHGLMADDLRATTDVMKRE
jgi:hypothetical protein